MVGRSRVGRCIRRIIDRQTRPQVKVVQVGTQQERIVQQADQEQRVDVRQAHDAQLQGEDLVEGLRSPVSGVSERRSHDMAGIFRPVLVTVRQVHLGTAAATRIADEARRNRNQFGETQSTGDTKFIGADIVVQLELEIPQESQVQPLPSPEDILVIISELRGDAQQAVGVGRCLQVHLEPLDGRTGKIDVAIHDGAVFPGHHAQVDPAEHLQGRETPVRIVHVAFPIHFPRNEGVHLTEYFLPDFHIVIVSEPDIADGILPVLPGRCFRFVPGIFPDAVFQHRILPAEGIRLEEIVILVEAEETRFPQHGGRPFALAFQKGFREVIPLVYQ